ncbi:MAG: hypothetical protein HZA28_05190 [Candidatus Omnitrophica bacterium]|nr:hypothetical protein [Candidatus Omnitrophota bacterium]
MRTSHLPEPANGRRYTESEVRELLKIPEVKDALKDPFARFVMLSVNRINKTKRAVMKKTSAPTATMFNKTGGDDEQIAISNYR